jgi:hypothetical protein
MLVISLLSDLPLIYAHKSNTPNIFGSRNIDILQKHVDNLLEAEEKNLKEKSGRKVLLLRFIIFAIISVSSN